MTITEAAMQLGTLIKESETYKNLEKAKKNYEECSEINDYMDQYQTTQAAIDNEAQKKEQDTKIIEVLQSRLDELYDLITGHDVYKALIEAQEKSNQQMEDVNNQITFAITGEYPCTHDCSSCHSNCHH